MDSQNNANSNPSPEPVFSEALRQRARDYLLNTPRLCGLVSPEDFCEALSAMHEAEQVPGLMECIFAEAARMEKTGELVRGFPKFDYPEPTDLVFEVIDSLSKSKTGTDTN
jgi:hypothetical protein